MILTLDAIEKTLGIAVIAVFILGFFIKIPYDVKLLVRKQEESESRIKDLQRESASRIKELKEDVRIVRGDLSDLKEGFSDLRVEVAEMSAIMKSMKSSMLV